MAFRIFTVLAVAALIISTWILSSPARRQSTQSAGKQPDLPGYYLKNAILTDYDAAGAPSIRAMPARNRPPWRWPWIARSGARATCPRCRRSKVSTA